MVSGTLYELRSAQPSIRQPADERDSVTFCLPVELRFPTLAMTETREMRESQLANLSASRDYATFKVKEEEFSLDREAEHVSLNCSFAPGVEAIDKNRHVRIREALGFALGQFIHPFAFDLVRVTGERVRVLRAPAQSTYPTREKCQRSLKTGR
jgi:hypothetical protein